MRFTEEKKKEIRSYLLEKIREQKPGLSKAVAEALGVNQATVHGYLNELADAGAIVRVRRGEYRLVRQQFDCTLDLEAGDFDDETEVYDRCLREHVRDFPKNVRDIWAYAFSEMMNNVIDHSGADTVRILVTQDCLDTEVTITDNGEGIFEHIRRYFRLPSAEDAILELFKGKLTTDAQHHSGEGIFFTSRLMDTFVIISGGKSFTHNRYDAGRVFDIPDFSQGTCVVMRLSNHSAKQPQEVFDRYSDVDGGFSRTHILLKNMFDASPVSRSQAKRVCSRLGQFREVVLDFEDVSWMGQGFAHQVFVVFRNEHPAVKLVPVHMNEAVEKMYRHVTAPGD